MPIYFDDSRERMQDCYRKGMPIYFDDSRQSKRKVRDLNLENLMPAKNRFDNFRKRFDFKKMSR